MNEFLKMVRELFKKGFATKEEKTAVTKAYDALPEADREVMKEDKEKAFALPDENPEDKKDVTEKEVTEMLTKLVGGVKDETITAVKGQVDAWLKEQRELIEKKSGLYKPEVKEERKELNKQTRKFLLAVLEGDVPVAKALADENLKKLGKTKELTTDDDSSPYGGYLVDHELSAEIRHIMTEYGVARSEMMTIQLSKNSYKANELVTDATVYWVDEGVAMLSTQTVLGQTELTLKKLGIIATATRELLQDQEVDIFSFIAERVGELLARAEDLAFFMGDGSVTYGGFTGLLKQTSTVNVVTMTGTTFASMTADDLLTMVDNTPTGALNGAKFYLHRSILSIVRKLKDDDHQYLYQRPSESGPSTIWGFPTKHVEVFPASSASAAATAFVLFGNLKKGTIFGYKGAIDAKRFDSGVVRNVANGADINLITSDREAIRWVERVGYIQVITTLNKPLTILKTAAPSA
jgi:HK97 family phage major capsid protein